ncbi:MAG: AEC family transporter [Planctomycetota bacterium]|nr:MAG: AEC family transporter [Planctomycetota bacterium]
MSFEPPWEPGVFAPCALSTGFHSASMPSTWATLTPILGAIAPVFIIIALGRAVAWKGMLSDRGIHELTRVLYWVCLPALLVDRLGQSLPPVHTVLLGSLVGVIACTMIIVMSAVLSRRLEPAQRGTVINGCFRMNGAFVGLPVIILLAASLQLEGLEARYFLMMAVMVPVTNALAVIAFLLPGRGLRRDSLSQVAGEVVRNPIILASMLGIGLGISGLGAHWSSSPPGVAIRFLGDSSIPLALILAGASLDLSLLRRSWAILASVSIAKLLLAPACVLVVAWLCNLDRATTLALVILLGSPTAVSAVPMARQLGGDSTLMAAIIVATTLLSPITLLLWLVITV